MGRALEVRVLPNVGHGEKEILQGLVGQLGLQKRLAQDLPEFRLRGAAVLRGSNLEHPDDRLIEIPDYQLRHGEAPLISFIA
jgi:hypothetical protein